MPLFMNFTRSNVFRSLAIILSFCVVWLSTTLLSHFEIYHTLYEQYPDALVTVSFRILQILLTIILLAVIRRQGLLPSIRQLGFDQPIGEAMGFVLLAVLPLLLVYLLLEGLNPDFSWTYFVFSALVAPVFEEILFRGFLFGQLMKWVKWPFWAAAMANVVPFAWSHLYQSNGTITEDLSILLLIGSGAFLFAWLYKEWDFNIWVLIGYHAAANALFYIFSPGDTVIANTLSTVMIIFGVFNMIMVTKFRTRITDFVQRQFSGT
jgi:membrane protease YdiL (CAAX protease family)